MGPEMRAEIRNATRIAARKQLMLPTVRTFMALPVGLSISS